MLLIISLLVSTFHYVKNISFCESIHFPYCIVLIENKKVQIPPGLKTFFFKVELSGKLENAARLIVYIVFAHVTRSHICIMKQKEEFA